MKAQKVNDTPLKVVPDKSETEFISKSFVLATVNAFKNQLSTTPSLVSVQFSEEHHDFKGDISGVISVVGEKINGSFAITFPESTFLKVISKMIGEDYKELTNDLLDGASELTNIIFGQAKVILNEKNYGLKMAIPTVVSGSGHILSSFCKSQVMVIQFNSELGPFFIKIGLN